MVTAHAYTTGMARSRVIGGTIDLLVIDRMAKEQAVPTFMRTLGCHPLSAYLDELGGLVER